MREETERDVRCQIANTLMCKDPIINSRSKKIHKYDPTTFKLVKVYPNMNECRKDNNNHKQLKIHADNNTIYNGHRWLIVQPNTPNVAQHLEPTVNADKNADIVLNVFYAKLNKDGTEILSVYPSQVSLGVSIGYSKKVAMSRISACIKNDQVIFNMYKAKKYNDCSDELRAHYELKYGEPDKSTIGKSTTKVKCINTINNTETIYRSMEHAYVSLNISSTTLSKYIKNGTIYCGMKFEKVTKNNNAPENIKPDMFIKLDERVLLKNEPIIKLDKDKKVCDAYRNVEIASKKTGKKIGTLYRLANEQFKARDNHYYIYLLNISKKYNHEIIDFMHIY